MTTTTGKRLRAAILLREAEEQEEQMTTDATVTIERAAADIGNATWLVALKDGDKARIISQPTAKAQIGLALPARLDSDEFVIERAGVPTALGLAALRYAEEPIAARGHSDRYGAFTADFVLAGLAHLAGYAPKIAVKRLIVTAPAEYIGQVESQLVKALAKTHSFSARGKPISLTINRVEIVSEGVAALAGLPGEGIVLLISGGGGTTHVAWRLANGRVDARTRQTGLQKALDAADDQIRREHGGRLSALERWELETALATGQPYKARVNGTNVDVGAVVRAWYDAVADGIVQDIKSRVPQWQKAATIWLVGGQALHLADHYKAAFPGIKIPPKPVEAEVRGALGLIETEREA